MKKIVDYLGGSHSYGLDTPQSDYDYRGVYVNTEPGLILDPYQYHGHVRCASSIEGETDKSYHELRHFFHMLRAGNSQAIELLFVDPQTLVYTTPLWNNIRDRYDSLLDPDKIYKSLSGYIKSETNLAIGARTGKLGGKRQAAVSEYGFSPKNFTQVLRLAYAGTAFFKTGYFPVNVKIDKPELCDFLLEIKCNPGQFTVDELKGFVTTYEQELQQAYATHSLYNYEYNQAIVDDLLLQAYAPELYKLNNWKTKLKTWLKKKCLS